jgi:hypothetical protein
MSKSSSNLNEIVYSGRPKNEEPHVKKSVKRKSERIEYIVRVDLVKTIDILKLAPGVKLAPGDYFGMNIQPFVHP